MEFSGPGLLDTVVHGVQSLGFIDPTPVQARCIPLILSGQDMTAPRKPGWKNRCFWPADPDAPQRAGCSTLPDP